jgi:hypothetical protein
MRSRSIHDLLIKAEADGEGTPTPTSMNSGFATAQAQAQAQIQARIQAQTGHLSAPPHTPESHKGSLRKAKSTLSIRSPAQDSEGDRDEDVFHDAPEFGSGGSLRLRTRTGTGMPQQQRVSPVIARANLHRIHSTPTPATSLRGVPIFSVDDLSLRRPGASAMVHARRRVQSEASRKQPQQPPPKPRFIDLLNIWAWLQLLLSIAVIFVMAARLGPKAVVNNRRRASD